MKFTRTNLVIAFSSIALLIVLLIQVSWIVKTARIKEELFNEKANMILSKTTDAIDADQVTCGEIAACVAEGDASGKPAKLGRNEVQKIDSLFRHYMDFYNFHVEYSFIVSRPGKKGISLVNEIYGKPLGDISRENGVELKLILPQKKQYIMAEMGPLFVTSVLLILVVMIMFWQTGLSLLKEKMIARHTSDFLNNMAHEFKTPLTNINLAGKMIVRSIPAADEHKLKHYGGIILDENEKLRLQVEQVLGMTALEKGEIRLRRAEVDLHQVIRDAVKCMTIQLENKQGTVRMNLDAERFAVMGDRTLLTNALCNVLDNAIKYAKGAPELFIETKNEGGWLKVVVSDKGIGIQKEYHQKVFDQFFRVPTGDVHDVKGFGMGLAYVKKIVELHGGTVSLNSEAGKGTQFTIMLSNG